MKRKEESAQCCNDLGGQDSRERSEEEEVLSRFSSLKTQAKNFALFILQRVKHPDGLGKQNIGRCNILARKRAEQLLNCGVFLFLREYINGVVRVAHCFCCKNHLWCPGCALRRAARFVHTYLLHIKAALNADPDLVPVLITLTVKNGPDLLERYEHLSQAVTAMIQRRGRSLRKSNRTVRHTPFVHLHGGVASYEFKRGKDGEWHPHIHMLGLMDRRSFFFVEELVPVRMRKGDTVQQYKRVYIPKEFVSLLAQELWLLTGDSFICDVRGLYPRQQYSTLVPLSAEDLAKPVYGQYQLDEDNPNTPDSLFSGLCEAFKYAVKPGELSHEDWLHACLVLQERRLYKSFGCLYGKNVYLPDDDVDQLEGFLEDVPYIERLYRYSYSQEQYVHQDDRFMDNAVFPDHPFKPVTHCHKRFKSAVKEKSGILDDFDEWLNARQGAAPF